jgi:hypothetical protein
MMKNISLALGLVTILALQGCGGGGSGDTPGTTKSGSTSSYTSNSIKKSTTKKASTKVDSLSAEDDDTNKSDSTLSEKKVNTYKKLYILKKKTINFGDHNETTVYDLNASSDSYITYSTMTSTNEDTVVKKKYDYSTKNTLKVFVKNIIDEWELTQVATFADGTTKDVVDFSSESGAGYMINTFDPITFFGKRVVKNVKDIEKGLFNVQTYEFDELNATEIKDEKEILARDIVHAEVEPNFMDDSRKVTWGNAVYEFEEFYDVMINNSGNEE